MGRSSEDQQGKRRGRYAPPGPQRGLKWTAEDRKHYADLVAESPIASEPAKQNAARRATELARMCVELDGRERTVDEEKLLHAASTGYRRWLEVLRVTEKVRDEDDGL